MGCHCLLLNQTARWVWRNGRGPHLDLLISWLQSPSAVILEPRKIKSDTVSTVSLSISHEVLGSDAMTLMAHEDSVPRALIEPVGCHFWQRHTPVLFPPRHQESQNNFSHHFNSSTHTHTHTHTHTVHSSTPSCHCFATFLISWTFLAACRP